MALGIIQNHTRSVQGLPLQKHHGSLLGFSILYCVNFLATSFPAIRCWEVANCHWIYHQICQDWGPITNMKLLMVAFPRFSWTSNYQYISYVCVFSPQICAVWLIQPWQWKWQPTTLSDPTQKRPSSSQKGHQFLRQHRKLCSPVARILSLKYFHMWRLL